MIPTRTERTCSGPAPDAVPARPPARTQRDSGDAQDAGAWLTERLCSICQGSPTCATHGGTGVGVDRWKRVLCAGRKVRAGRVLFEQGDPTQAVYVVRSGTLKSALTLADGREVVCAFHMAGQVLALEGVGGSAHSTTATALEDTHVCTVHHGTLNELVQRNPALQASVNRLMIDEIECGRRIRTLLSLFSAQERLAAFLLDLSERYRTLGQSAHDFNLRMTRADIGSYLGMQLETVSRTFSTFQQQGMVGIDYRRVRIHDLAAFSRRYAGMMQP